MHCGVGVPGKFDGAGRMRLKAGSMRGAVGALFVIASCAGVAAGGVAEVATPAASGQVVQRYDSAHQAEGQGGYCDPLAVNGVAPACRTGPATMPVGSVRKDVDAGALLLLLQILRSPK